MSGRNPPPRIVNGQIVDGSTPVSTPQRVTSNAWSIVNVVALFFKTLINPEAEKQAVEEQTRRTGAMPNPWQQQQQRRAQNRMRGRPLGNIKGVNNVQSVQHRGGTGGG
mmetsp:Transcript_7409/g.11553  ORF Transcript_7409/g.11553 Transcript_7409/m.11553 type:complete len:109 (+) Transcript_7409:109-435(+)|eukprot:CAMPEP_0202706096 /NCGR_PEP_ID=MMETSP1385-20130828/18574_1 /ASSEMBLY_ACC=CAM_ASM_000861 /TAXON_ID=933848 /ORGANISM="Elphidium margaritaceum" /LENGTH=108 /DNA_ID=CAMNT_0049364487 /DNA_START=55 /DNA_END=381 /DNA_ORIENTATION=+